MILLGGSPAGSAPVATVAPDIAATIALAVAHLRGRGHLQLVALVPQELADETARELAVGLTTDAASRTVAVDGVEAARAAARVALAAPNRPTAIVCGTEQLALGVLQAARALAIAIPAGLSVLALTESWLAAATTPPLTTVATPAEALGAWAGTLLLERLSGGERSARSATAPIPRVTVRASTTAAPRVATALLPHPPSRSTQRRQKARVAPPSQYCVNVYTDLTSRLRGVNLALLPFHRHPMNSVR